MEGVAYDVTSFLPDHPGGASVILEAAGRDSTAEFLEAHPVAIMKVRSELPLLVLSPFASHHRVTTRACFRPRHTVLCPLRMVRCPSVFCVRSTLFHRKRYCGDDLGGPGKFSVGECPTIQHLT